jgi:hypothetical protein
MPLIHQALVAALFEKVNPLPATAALRIDSSTAARNPPVMTAADCCAGDVAGYDNGRGCR